MKRAQRGFTLIELMIVSAIIGILVSIAIPMYQDYVVRSRVSEMIALASGNKERISENIVNSGKVLDASSCDGVNSITTATENTASLTCAAGIVTVTGTAKAKGVALTYTPSVAAAGAINWTCTTDPDSHRYVPAACRGP